MNELNNFTRLFKRVKSNKELSAQEKLILSEIISYQLHGQPFKLKDATLSIELGMGSGAISKYVNRLYKRGIIDKSTVPFFSPDSGKPKRLRTIKVKNIEQWTSLKIDAKKEEEQSQITIPSEETMVESITLKPKIVPDSAAQSQTIPTSNIPLIEESQLVNDVTFINGVLADYLKLEKELQYQTINVKFKDGEIIKSEVLQTTNLNNTVCYILKFVIENIQLKKW